MKDGPFIAGLEDALKNLNVQRQAYQGGTFVGNHVHKLLKVWFKHTWLMHMNHVLQPENSKILCNSLVRVAQNNGGLLVQQATKVATLFTESFTLFSKCHNIYNAKSVNADDIKELG